MTGAGVSLFCRLEEVEMVQQRVPVFFSSWIVDLTIFCSNLWVNHFPIVVFCPVFKLCCNQCQPNFDTVMSFMSITLFQMKIFTLKKFIRLLLIQKLSTKIRFNVYAFLKKKENVASKQFHFLRFLFLAYCLHLLKY